MFRRLKVCSSCGNKLRLSEFHKNANELDGLNRYCKTCTSNRLKVRYLRKKAGVAKEMVNTLPVLNLTNSNQHLGNFVIPPRSVERLPIELATELANNQYADDRFSVDLHEIEPMLPFEDNGVIHFNYWSPFGTYDSCGHLSNYICKYMLRDSRLRPHIKPFNNWVDGDVNDVVRNSFNDVSQICKIGVLYHLPFSFSRLPNPYRILIGFYETDRLGPDFIRDYNNVDEVWTFSKFCHDVYSSYLTTKVIQLKCGYDPEEYYYGDLRDKDVFTFGIAGRLTGRKSVTETITAFTKAFKNQDDVRLFVKTRAASVPIVNDNRIRTINADWDVTQMRDFYQRLDSFVFATHGEGFGLPPLEASACGAYSIVTDFSGCSDYVIEPYFYPLTVSEIEPSTSMSQGGNWAVVDGDQLIESMRWCYNNRNLVTDRGIIASEYVKYHWNGSSIVDSIYNRLLEL